MRFMMIVKATKESESGILADEEMMRDMTNFNKEMVDAGILEAAEGLHPSYDGARIMFSGNNRTVVHGPFPQPEELAAGYWLINVKSLDEAIAWAKRAPKPMKGDSVIEIRQIWSEEEFADLVPADLIAEVKRLGERVANR